MCYLLYGGVRNGAKAPYYSKGPKLTGFEPLYPCRIAGVGPFIIAGAVSDTPTTELSGLIIVIKLKAIIAVYYLYLCSTYTNTVLPRASPTLKGIVNKRNLSLSWQLIGPVGDGARPLLMKGMPVAPFAYSGG